MSINPYKFIAQHGLSFRPDEPVIIDGKVRIDAAVLRGQQIVGIGRGERDCGAYWDDSEIMREAIKANATAAALHAAANDAFKRFDLRTGKFQGEHSCTS